MTVERLDAEMSGLELTHWQAFFKIEAEKYDKKPKKDAGDALDD